MPRDVIWGEETGLGKRITLGRGRNRDLELRVEKDKQEETDKHVDTNKEQFRQGKDEQAVKHEDGDQGEATEWWEENWSQKETNKHNAIPEDE